MSKRFRIVKPAHKCQTPIEALQLVEDMQRISFMLDCCDKLMPESIVQGRDDAKEELRLLKMKLRAWHRHAERRLRTEFLREQK